MRRPYVFLFREERDPCERGIINLARANTEYSDPTSNSASAASSANHQEIVSAVGISHLHICLIFFIIGSARLRDSAIFLNTRYRALLFITS